MISISESCLHPESLCFLSDTRVLPKSLLRLHTLLNFAQLKVSVSRLHPENSCFFTCCLSPYKSVFPSATNYIDYPEFSNHKNVTVF